MKLEVETGSAAPGQEGADQQVAKRLPAFKRLEVARRFMKMKAEGTLTDAMLGQKWSAIIEAENPVKNTGAVEMVNAGFNRLDLTLQKLSTGRTLNNYVAKSPTDVLSSLVNTVTTTNQQVLARIDLEPIIYNWFVKKFPALDRIMKERSNGLNHTWDLSTSFDEDDAQFIAELAAAPFGQGVYGQANTNIAILATVRGMSYKEQEGIAASGMTWTSDGDGGMDGVDLELQRGAWAMAKKFQTAFYQGTTSASGLAPGTVGTPNEFGINYGSAAFNGLRVLVSPNANSVAGNGAFYPTGFGPVVVDKGSATITDSANSIAQQIMDNGGDPSAIHISATAATKLAIEGGNLIRYGAVDVSGGLVLGNTVRAIDTVAGQLPIVVIPGTSIGSYTPSGGLYAGTPVEDIYILDESVLSFPFLGSAVPTTLEIPMGFDRVLARRFLIFWLAGFAMKIPLFNGKIRIPR